MKRQSIEELLSELKAKSGIGQQSHDRLSNKYVNNKLMSMLRFDEDDDSAQNEGFKNRANALAKRMEGIGDILTNNDAKSAIVALAKLCDDSKTLLDDLRGQDSQDTKEPEDNDSEEKPKKELDKEKEKQASKEGQPDQKQAEQPEPKELSKEQSSKTEDVNMPHAFRKELLRLSGQI